MSENEQWSRSIAKTAVRIRAIENDAQHRGKIADGRGQDPTIKKNIKAVYFIKFILTRASFMNTLKQYVLAARINLFRT